MKPLHFPQSSPPLLPPGGIYGVDEGKGYIVGKFDHSRIEFGATVLSVYLLKSVELEYCDSSDGMLGIKTLPLLLLPVLAPKLSVAGSFRPAGRS